MANTWRSVICGNRWTEFCALANSSSNKRDSKGLTLLYYAAYYGRIRMAQYLVQRGADVNMPKQSNGCTPVFIAASRGHTDMVRVLIELKANANTLDKYGWTPLHVSACYGKVSTVKFLVEKCDVRINTKAVNGTTPISSANKGGHTEIAKYLEAREEMRMVMECDVVPFRTDIRKVIVKYLYCSLIVQNTDTP